MEKSLSFKNIKISYTDSGKGPVVVLLHGFLENKRMWKEIVPKVSNTNRVLAIDLLGHGQTDCLGYVHSMGGYVSLALADKRPEMIRGLCLLNSTSLSDDIERKKLRERANKMVQSNFTNMVRMSFVNLFGEENKAVFAFEIENALNDALKTSLQGYMACQEGMRIRPNRMAVLKNNSFKKLYILGKKDPVLSVKEALEEAKETQTESVVLSGGHMSHIENTNELLIALQKFVKQC